MNEHSTNIMHRDLSGVSLNKIPNQDQKTQLEKILDSSTLKDKANFATILTDCLLQIIKDRHEDKKSQEEFATLVDGTIKRLCTLKGNKEGITWQGLIEELEIAKALLVSYYNIIECNERTTNKELQFLENQILQINLFFRNNQGVVESQVVDSNDNNRELEDGASNDSTLEKNLVKFDITGTQLKKNINEDVELIQNLLTEIGDCEENCAYGTDTLKNATSIFTYYLEILEKRQVYISESKCSEVINAINDVFCIGSFQEEKIDELIEEIKEANSTGSLLTEAYLKQELSTISAKDLFFYTYDNSQCFLIAMKKYKLENNEDKKAELLNWAYKILDHLDVAREYNLSGFSVIDVFLDADCPQGIKKCLTGNSKGSFARQSLGLDAHSNTYLHKFAAKGWAGVCSACVELWAEVLSPKEFNKVVLYYNYKGATSLCMATFKRHVDAINSIVATSSKFGIPISKAIQCDYLGNTVLHYGVNWGAYDFVKQTIKNLEELAKDNTEVEVQKLILQPNKMRKTAMEWAAKKKLQETTELLISKCPDIVKKDGNEYVMRDYLEQFVKAVKKLQRHPEKLTESEEAEKNIESLKNKIGSLFKQDIGIDKFFLNGQSIKDYVKWKDVPELYNLFEHNNYNIDGAAKKRQNSNDEKSRSDSDSNNKTQTKLDMYLIYPERESLGGKRIQNAQKSRVSESSNKKSKKDLKPEDLLSVGWQPRAFRGVQSTGK